MAELTDEQVTTLRGVARAAGGCFMRLPHQVRFVESFDDLAQVGFIGALKSHRTFDPTKGKNYRAWLFVGAKGEIRHWLRDHARPIKRPRSVYKAFVHGEVDLTSDHISSLDVPLTGYDNPMAVGDMIPAPPDGIENAELMLTLRQTLPFEEYVVIAMWLCGFPQAEIGQRMQCSQKRVSRLFRRGLELLRASA